MNRDDDHEDSNADYMREAYGAPCSRHPGTLTGGGDCPLCLAESECGMDSEGRERTPPVALPPAPAPTTKCARVHYGLPRERQHNCTGGRMCRGDCKPGITVRIVTIDHHRETRTFTTLAGAQRYAHEKVGRRPTIGTVFRYAVDDYGCVTLYVSGAATLADLFPDVKGDL